MVGIFYSYVGYIWVKYGILPSISDSWYELPDKQKPLFTLFCWGFALPAAIIGFTLSQGSPFQFLMFFASAGILFVGAAPDFKEKSGLDRKIHYIAAITSVISSTIFQLIIFKDIWYIPTTFILGSLFMYLFRKRVHEIWWIETLTFTSFTITTGLMIYKILLHI